MCCWRSPSSSLQVRHNKHYVLILTDITVSQVNVQHNSPDVRCESHIRTTSDHRPKVPRLAPTSHLRDLRVSGPFEADQHQTKYFPLSSSECEVLHGECIQTYVPYLFLVIPLGPVTLTGQVGNKQISNPNYYIFPWSGLCSRRVRMHV